MLIRVVWCTQVSGDDTGALVVWEKWQRGSADDDDAGGAGKADDDKATAFCPVCQRFVDENIILSHLEECLQKSGPAETA